jgi:hypothetical protein
MHRNKIVICRDRGEMKTDGLLESPQDVVTYLYIRVEGSPELETIIIRAKNSSSFLNTVTHLTHSLWLPLKAQSIWPLKKWPPAWKMPML